MTACDAFVRHHAEYTCRNYQRKSYRTKCACLTMVLEGQNSDQKISQVCASLWEFFTRVKLAQKLVVKEWIRNVDYSGARYKRRKTSVAYILPGVYHDAPIGLDEEGVYNKRPFKVCLNIISLLYDYGYFKIVALRKDMENAGVKEHRLKGINDKYANATEKYKSINTALSHFFTELQGEAETHSTRVIREATGLALRDEEVDSVELPSSFSKRRLYYRFCFKRGYAVKSDHKGKMPALKYFPVRKTFDAE